MERIFKIRPAWDKRDPDPRKNYGIHGVEFAFFVKGPEGTIQFILYTNWQLPHVQQETDARTLRLAASGPPAVKSITAWGAGAAAHLESAHRLIGGGSPALDQMHLSCFYHPKAFDIGYHSPKPMYEEQTPMGAPGDCEWVPEGCSCYYDGSSLNAERFLAILIEGGDEKLWDALEAEYRGRFKEALAEAPCPS